MEPHSMTPEKEKDEHPAAVATAVAEDHKAGIVNLEVKEEHPDQQQEEEEPPMLVHMPVTPPKPRRVTAKKQNEKMKRMGVAEMLKLVRDKFIPEEGEIVDGGGEQERPMNRRVRRQQALLSKLAAVGIDDDDENEEEEYEQWEDVGGIDYRPFGFEEKEEGELSDSEAAMDQQQLRELGAYAYVLTPPPPPKVPSDAIAELLVETSPADILTLFTTLYEHRDIILQRLSIWQKAQLWDILQKGLLDGQWESTQHGPLIAAVFNDGAKNGGGCSSDSLDYNWTGYTMP